MASGLTALRARGRRQLEKAAGVRRSVQGRSVGLTFDDGPWPGATDRVLELLEDLEVTATFFCVGKNVEAHPDLLDQIVAHGHQVGSHSYSHTHPTQLDPQRLLDDYRRGAAVLSDALGAEVRLFRPPHGHIGLRSSFDRRFRALQPWLWTQDTEDWRAHQHEEQLAARVSGVRGGDVILCHDWVEQPWHANALDRGVLLRALPTIVERVRARGLSFGYLS